MGTCGIAAGAKESLDAFIDEIEKKNLGHVTVKQTGCMGLCYVEPTIEVKVPGMPDTIYGKVDADTARIIVDEHIINKKLVNNHILISRQLILLKVNGGKDVNKNYILVAAVQLVNHPRQMIFIKTS